MKRSRGADYNFSRVVRIRPEFLESGNDFFVSLCRVPSFTKFRERQKIELRLLERQLNLIEAHTNHAYHWRAKNQFAKSISRFYRTNYYNNKSQDDGKPKQVIVGCNGDPAGEGERMEFD